SGAQQGSCLQTLCLIPTRKEVNGGSPVYIFVLNKLQYGMVIRIEFRIGDAMGRHGIAATPRLEHIMVINGLPTHFPYVIDMQYMVVRITVALGTAEI